MLKNTCSVLAHVRDRERREAQHPSRLLHAPDLAQEHGHELDREEEPDEPTHAQQQKRASPGPGGRGEAEGDPDPRRHDHATDGGDEVEQRHRVRRGRDRWRSAARPGPRDRTRSTEEASRRSRDLAGGIPARSISATTAVWNHASAPSRSQGRGTTSAATTAARPRPTSQAPRPRLSSFSTRPSVHRMTTSPSPALKTVACTQTDGS